MFCICIFLSLPQQPFKVDTCIFQFSDELMEGNFFKVTQLVRAKI